MIIVLLAAFIALIVGPAIWSCRDNIKTSVDKKITKNKAMSMSGNTFYVEGDVGKTLTELGIEECEETERQKSGEYLYFNTKASKLIKFLYAKRWIGDVNHFTGDSGGFYTEPKEMYGKFFIGVFKTGKGNYFVYICKKPGGYTHRTKFIYCYDRQIWAFNEFNNYKRLLKLFPEDAISEKI